MKYVIEYHMVEGKMVGRECSSEEEQRRLVDSFAGSRKGVHDYEIELEDTGQKARVVIPLDQVKVVRAYAVEDSKPAE